MNTVKLNMAQTYLFKKEVIKEGIRGFRSLDATKFLNLGIIDDLEEEVMKGMVRLRSNGNEISVRVCDKVEAREDGSLVRLFRLDRVLKFA